VVAVAMFASLTVLPAILSKLGDKVEWGRLPFLARIRRRRAGRSAWGVVVDRVMRHPVAATIVSAGLLVALAIPALSLNTVVRGPDDLPRDIPVGKTFDRLTAAFPGEGAEARVVVEADDVRAQPVAGAIARVGREAEAAGVAVGAVSVETSDNGKVAAIDIP